MNHSIVKKVICCLTLIICVGILSGSNEAAQKKGKKYLVKKCTVYSMTEKDTAWWFDFKNTYKYNSNKHLVSVTEKTDGNTAFRKLRWKNAGSPSSTAMESYFEEVTNYIFKDGRRMSAALYTDYGNGYLENKTTYKYNRHGDVASDSFEEHNNSSDLYDRKFDYKFKYKYYKNGFPKIAYVSTQLSERTGKRIKKSKRVTIQKQSFDNKGLFTEIFIDHFDTGENMVKGGAVRYLFTNNYNKAGLITETIITGQRLQNGTPEWTYRFKVKYEYTNIEIDKRRYTKMMNDLNCKAIGPSFLHYRECWY